MEDNVGIASVKLIGGKADKKVLGLARALLKDMNEEPDERRPDELLAQFEGEFPLSSYSNRVTCGAAARLRRMEVRDLGYDEAVDELRIICELIVAGEL